MAVSGNHDQLPCGAKLDSLLAQVAEGQAPASPGHQADCAYCQTALRTLREGWEDVQVLARQPVSIPAGLTARIMARVGAIARRASDAILLGHPRGETRVSHALIGRAIQRLAARVPGVVFASARAVQADSPDPTQVSVAIRLVVRFGPTIERVAGTVRATLDRHVPSLTGAQLSRIDIAVEDLVTAPESIPQGPGPNRL